VLDAEAASVMADGLKVGFAVWVWTSGMAASAQIEGGKDHTWLTGKQGLRLMDSSSLDNGEATMSRCNAYVTQSCFAVMLMIVGPVSVAPAVAQDKGKQEDKVAGILIDKKDNWFTVKADGEEEPVKYLVDGTNKKLTEAMKGIFNASRVQLTYKQDGDSRQLASIKRQVLKVSGTMTGTVVKVYNDFWVEVKFKDGPNNAFAPSVNNYKNKAFMDALKGLQPGESVTITFSTDFERHRIEWFRKN
jgi:hypothetical protein